MKQLHAIPKKRLLTTALLLALASPAIAQEQPSAAAGPQGEISELDTVVVTGIRASLESSMNLKRDSQGLVDGIVAEDIGKFPDTNLAESLQRISGVSIDRNNGEGSRATVRGVGPDFNLVLLNGRQMPTVTGGRAFEFSNLASESVSAVEVYKTSRAENPTGGLGATINIKTARPLENPGTRVNVGMKGVWDTSDDDMPKRVRGDTVTPELSAIFSTTSADGRFGAAVSASYQERDSGSARAHVAAGWREFIDTPQASGEGGGSMLPLPGTPGSENITNRPGPNDVYGLPQNLEYVVTRTQRQRTNAQVTLQWAPTDNLTATLDYTYAQNKVQAQSNNMSVWQGFNPDSSTWTSGSGASPEVLHESYPWITDFANGASDTATRYKSDSVGLNLAWDVSDNLSLGLDYHHSEATNEPDGPYGSNNVVAALGNFRLGNTLDFSRDFPVLTIDMLPGMTEVDPSMMMVAGSIFGAGYQHAEIDQAQASGEFRFGNYSKLNFGVAATDYKNHSASTNVQLDTWGGATNPGDYPDEVWPLAHMGDFFKGLSGHDDPAFSDGFFLYDFKTMRDLAEKAWVASGKGIAADYWPTFDYSFAGTQVPGTAANRSNSVSHVREKSKSVYLQWSSTFDWAMPVDIAAGVRWEKTEVEASAQQSAPSGIDWISENEFVIRYSGSEFRSLGGKYDYVLPNLDIALNLTGDMKLRASYGETIGRANWGDLNPALGVGGQTRYDGGNGGSGNPALLPLESRNIDLSWEWYYGDSSYLSVGYFHKKIDNFIARQVSTQTPYPNLHTPSGGAYWDAAIASGCTPANRVCIRDYIFANYDGQPGVDAAAGSISGLPSDPLADFKIDYPVNNRSDKLDGWEFNIQHVFGDSGFGLAANYTLVDSGLTYDAGRLGTQFAMTGLSDTANLVGFYDKGPWQVRAAYNWRDKFLAGLGSTPTYVEAYGQIDLNVSYQVNDHLSLSVEGINITDESTRAHGRNSRQLHNITQLGPRYMFGLRYRF
ncbi:TonB-dependent receptor [Pseudoxanthomonas broegbernensis]|uniref:TonB-dependent receptor n=1 Tax=Pseudoxanthomonas broegbernensis TaxID=83619 RepID=A0A7V8K7D0_9GAMM|nr:TonB-dependent receptor [Pseudoxanthomonas broegbernensis]KAF1686990.1 TonB-dependent receptor [Pseudoxanthomonas broegbernensis]MBB6065395.1 TonB-dependent receptor [Pseudoxanthomonas broegbernensis]